MARGHPVDVELNAGDERSTAVGVGRCGAVKTVWWVKARGEVSGGV